MEWMIDPEDAAALEQMQREAGGMTPAEQ